MVSLRLDDELAAQLEAFSRSQNVSRSAAIRVLLGAALGEESKRTIAREVILVFLGIKKRFVTKLVQTVHASIPELEAEVDSELAREEVGA